MSTPLGLAKRMRLAFPEFSTVRIVREGPGALRAYCELATGSVPIPPERIDQWIDRNRVAGTIVSAEQVVVIPVGIHDDEELLHRTSLPRILAEEANVTVDGLRRALVDLFREEVLDVSDGVGRVTVHVRLDLPQQREQPILDATRLLMACDPLGIDIDRRPGHGRQGRPTDCESAGASESATTYKLLAEDTAFLHERLPGALDEAAPAFPQPLPEGVATYASPHDGVESLLHRLALFERVYVYLPLSRADFPQWVGTSADEFLAALPTGRIIPVFGHKLDRYEAGLSSSVLDAGAPRVVLYGEYALRTIGSFANEHKLLSLIGTEDGAKMRRDLASIQDEQLEPFRRYADAIADIADRFTSVALSGPALSSAWFPLADWLDSAVKRFDLPSRSLELCTAVEYRAIAESFGGVPLSQAGHYLDGYLRFIYGALQGDAAVDSTEVLRIPDPTLIARICFPDTTGLTVKEFSETFVGPRVDAMRALLSSHRVQSADGNEDMVRAFNDELAQYNRRATDGYTAVGVLLGVAGLVGGLGIPALLLGLSLELAKRVTARRSPSVFATLTSKLTGATREGALLARITKS